MAVPTIGTTLVSVGSVAASATLIATVTAAANVGDVVLVTLSFPASSVSTVIDSKGNTYVQIVNWTNGALWAALVTKALVNTDTVTITMALSVQGIAVTIQQVSGVVINNVATSGYTAIGSTKAGTSTLASSNALASTRNDDSLFLMLLATLNGSGQVLLTDFSSGSVDSSYTKLGAAVSAGGTSGSGVQLCYKTVAAINPMPSQSPTFTLNTARSWTTFLVQLSGLTARGAIGVSLRTGVAAFSTASYVPHPVDVLGKVNYGQIGKSINDGFPKPVITPGKAGATRPDSDGILLSE